MLAGDHGASCGCCLRKDASHAAEWNKVINPYTTSQDSTSSPWVEHVSTQLTSTRSVLWACVGWVVELGLRPEMPFYQKKNLTLINTAAFISLFLAFPGTFLLMVMGFGHPFSLLISGVLWACLILGFNGAGRTEWSKALFSFAPAAILTSYTLLELSPKGINEPLVYLLAHQGLCFALLLPVLIYGFDNRQKVALITGISFVLFLAYDVGSMQTGMFQEKNITGLSHGLFTVLSLMQYAALAACVIYMQNYASQHAQLIQQANEKLEGLAIRDGLTGLYNHGFMEQMITDAINRSRRTSNPLAMLMIDVDFFKQVNDTFGHNAGDEVLVRLTRLLRASVRSTDYLGRWGGDELILLLTNTNLVGANNLAEKLRILVENQVFPYSKRLTLSLGASEYKDGDSATNIIARADMALYRAKRAGRNRVEMQPGFGDADQ